MSDLKEIARNHGTDKFEHGYCPFYEKLIGHYTNLNCTLLEMGVAQGNSLRTWREWLPQSRILGLDGSEYTPHPGDERLEVFKGRQEHQDVLQNLINVAGSFDIVVDDAGHEPENQTAAFNYLWPHLANDGWYVIEDMNADTPVIKTAIEKDNVADIHFLLGDQRSWILFIHKKQL